MPRVPSCAICILRRTGPGPDLPADCEGATRSKTLSQVGIEEFCQDLTLTCLLEQARAGERELKILAQDFKDDADEPVTETFGQ